MKCRTIYNGIKCTGKGFPEDHQFNLNMIAKIGDLMEEQSIHSIEMVDGTNGLRLKCVDERTQVLHRKSTALDITGGLTLAHIAISLFGNLWYADVLTIDGTLTRCSPQQPVRIETISMMPENIVKHLFG